ncbi:uncharacterized protein LOC112592776 isoform X1 [Melanaphis sacchari]|uniref:uncharacterized protein LOC112592776 isoform X1 n=1 Tax=Melanaphis sacchari TaxID=742174 RepID=UPI000DC15161|nr:uncharacterized protein LOC112592776 isoform X1 [Melanaphis sacchari]XP_025192712.1 uncharacterized protein LOC112592776 isoform X1 [Melanaphis sacchari]
MSRPTMLYYDDEDEEGSPDSVGFIEEDHPLQLHGNRELAAQAVKLLQVPSRPGDASFASSTTDMDVPIYVRGSSSRSLGNRHTHIIILCIVYCTYNVNTRQNDI